MPLVRIDMHTPLADLRPQMSEAINSALADGWGMPADDLFQIFQLHEQGDLSTAGPSRKPTAPTSSSSASWRTTGTLPK